MLRKFVLTTILLLIVACRSESSQAGGDEAWRFQGVATYEQMEEEILAQVD